MQYSQTDYENAELVFLLEIDWFGYIHRFSTKPIVFDGNEYGGSMSEITFEESTDDIGINPESNIASIALHFDGYNMVEEYRKGRTLEGQKATLSYVLTKEDQLYSTHAIIVLSGLIQEPIIADPEEPVSFVAFSIEQKEYDIETPVIPPRAIITDSKFPYSDENAIGKRYPLVIGEPGKTRKGGAITQLYSTPAYNYKKDNVGSPTHEVRYVIAYHSCFGENVTISDNVTAPLTRTIEAAVDAEGQRYSYIDLSFSSLLYPGATSLSNNAAHPDEFWITWSDGGGMKSPYRDEVLSGGGDVVRWLLSRTNAEIDDGAFANISPILNDYRFAGFVNDDTTAASMLSDHILPFLPIQIKYGPKGLRPILHQYIAIQHVQPITHVIADKGDWIRISPLETKTNTSEIYNAVRINFAWNGQTDSFFHALYMGPNAEDNDLSKNNLYSSTSANRYGISEESFDAMFIYEIGTAARVAGDFIRRKSFPQRFLRFAASKEYGFLQLGDIIELTSDSLFMDRQKCSVVSKIWDVSEWIFVLMFEDSPLHTDRTF